MVAENRPGAEVEIGEALVRSLLREQHPDLAELALVEIASGWDNVILRLGDDLTVRMPRRQAAAALVIHEQRWLPGLAARLPLPVPAPVRVGRPGAGYRWSWSINRWFPGDNALRTPPADPFQTAESLGAFLAALQTPAPPDAPPNPFRGVPLAARAAAVEERTGRLDGLIDGAATRACWAALVATPPWSGPPVWLHGDLHPGNLLVVGGRLSAVIDFGDITSGDPATDLAVAWMAFPPEARDEFRRARGGVDDDTWARSRGWALALSLAYLANSADMPAFAALGRRTLAAVLADSAGDAPFRPEE